MYGGEEVACKFIEKTLEKGKCCDKIFKNKIKIGIFYGKIK